MHPRQFIHLHTLQQFFKCYLLDYISFWKWFFSSFIPKYLLSWSLWKILFFNFQRLLGTKNHFNFSQHDNFPELSDLLHDGLIWRVLVKIFFSGRKIELQGFSEIWHWAKYFCVHLYFCFWFCKLYWKEKVLNLACDRTKNSFG